MGQLCYQGCDPLDVWRVLTRNPNEPQRTIWMRSRNVNPRAVVRSECRPGERYCASGGGRERPDTGAGPTNARRGAGLSHIHQFLIAGEEQFQAVLVCVEGLLAVEAIDGAAKQMARAAMTQSASCSWTFVAGVHRHSESSLDQP